MTENTENGDATKPTGPIEVWIRQKKAAGFTCVNSGAATTVCGQYCRVGGTDCTVGLKCTALQANGKDVVLGGITYGACL